MKKVQVHFLNFLCSLLNDSIRAFASDKTKIFLEFDYKMKSKISSKNFNMQKIQGEEIYLKIWENLRNIKDMRKIIINSL